MRGRKRNASSRLLPAGRRFWVMAAGRTVLKLGARAEALGEGFGRSGGLFEGAVGGG